MTDVHRLDQVCEITMGQAPAGQSYNVEGQGLPLIAGAGDFGEVYPAVKKFTSAAGKMCRHGDIVLGIRATIGEKVVADRDYCLGRGVAGLRPKGGLHDRYLWHWLSEVGPVLASKAKGATFKQVNREDIGSLRIPLPSFFEQCGIAAILDKADELRAMRRAALAQLDTLTQSIFLDMFGEGSVVLQRWPTTPLGELLDFMTSGSRGWAQYYGSDGSLFLRIQNVGRDEISLGDVAYVHAPDTAEAKRTAVRPGDVLLSITADLGRTGVVPEGLGSAFINQHLCILRTSALRPRYLSAYLSSQSGQDQISRQNREAVKAGLNFDDIRSLLVPLPPHQLQDRFVQAASAVDVAARQCRDQLDELRALCASLQDRAFRDGL